MIKEFYNEFSKKLRTVVLEFERKRTGQESCEPWQFWGGWWGRRERKLAWSATEISKLLYHRTGGGGASERQQASPASGSIWKRDKEKAKLVQCPRTKDCTRDPWIEIEFIKKGKPLPGWVAHTLNPSTLEGARGRSMFVRSRPSWSIIVSSRTVTVQWDPVSTKEGKYSRE